MIFRPAFIFECINDLFGEIEDLQRFFIDRKRFQFTLLLFRIVAVIIIVIVIFPHSRRV